MIKKTLIVANWKMHLNTHESSLLVKRLHDHIKQHRTVEVVLAPSVLVLQPLSLELDRRVFRLAAQDANAKDEGAYTGEVSFTMLRELVQYAIIGHSERRIYFAETLETVRDKVQAAVRNGITPILCVGETHQERVNGETSRVIHDQVTTALSNLTPEEIEDVVIAYEPVWAISTFGGEIAKPTDIKKVLDLIRKTIADLYGDQSAQHVRVLYGGSVSADTAPGYLAIDGCDGALVGSASLNYKQFSSIVDVAYRLSHGEEEIHG
ncbi:MAG: triose-phosphate isomerase [Patescibacteria group bacterium]|nr:triose-phosphate isomerase [Patescibacteria group bacterium]